MKNFKHNQYVVFLCVCVLLFCMCLAHMSNYLLGRVSLQELASFSAGLVQRVDAPLIQTSNVELNQIPSGLDGVFQKNDSTISFAVPEGAKYLSIDIRVYSASNTIAEIRWESAGEVTAQPVKLTNRLNCIPVPPNADSAQLTFNTLVDGGVYLCIEDLAFFSGFPGAIEIWLKVAAIALPLAFMLYLYVFRKNSIYFEKTYPKQWIASTVFAGVFILLYLAAHNPINQYYDASAYLSLGESIVQPDGINLENYPQTIRGYVLPLLIGLSQRCFAWIVSPMTSYFIVCTVLYAVAFGVLIPKVAKKLLGFEASVFSTLVFVLLFLAFFGSHLTYILSDLPAAMLVLTAVLLLANVCDRDSKKGILLETFFMGIATYMAYNTRTAYIFVMLLIPIILLCHTWKNGISFFLIAIAGYMLGIGLVAIPQIYINYHVNGLVTPFVITGANGGLYTAQLQWGLYMQRYETYVGIGESAVPGIIFSDPIGLEILEENFGGEVNSISEYLLQVLQHPFTFLGIYGRHFANVLNNCYPAYIESFENTAICSVLSYTLWFMLPLGLILGSKNTTETFSNKKLLCLIQDRVAVRRLTYVVLALISPVISVIGAFELRFFIIGYIFLYLYVTMGISYKILLPKIKKYSSIIVLLYIIGLMLCFAIWPEPVIAP